MRGPSLATATKRRAACSTARRRSSSITTGPSDDGQLTATIPLLLPARVRSSCSASGKLVGSGIEVSVRAQRGEQRLELAVMQVPCTRDLLAVVAAHAGQHVVGSGLLDQLQPTELGAQQ